MEKLHTWRTAPSHLFTPSRQSPFGEVKTANPRSGAARDEAVLSETHAVCDLGGHELPSLCSLVKWTIIARTCGMRVEHLERGSEEVAA